MRCKTILIDPPWNETGGGKIKRGADRHYSLLKTKDIPSVIFGALQSNKWEIARDAHLYLWVTNNFLPDGLWLMKKLGFIYKTNIVWVKDRFGLGQYIRGKHEICLFGVRGVLPYKVIDGKRQQGVSVIEAPRTEHSKKPIEMYSLIEKVSYPPYLEMFARNVRENWLSWGNELEGIDNGG